MVADVPVIAPAVAVTDPVILVAAVPSITPTALFTVRFWKPELAGSLNVTVCALVPCRDVVWFVLGANACGLPPADCDRFPATRSVPCVSCPAVPPPAKVAFPPTNRSPPATTMRNCPLPLVANGPSIVSVAASTSSAPAFTTTFPPKWTAAPSDSTPPELIITDVPARPIRAGSVVTAVARSFVFVTCHFATPEESTMLAPTMTVSTLPRAFPAVNGMLTLPATYVRVAKITVSLTSSRFAYCDDVGDVNEVVTDVPVGASDVLCDPNALKAATDPPGPCVNVDPLMTSTPLVSDPDVPPPWNVAAPFTISESSPAFITSTPADVVWKAPPTTSVVALRLKLPPLTVTLPRVVERAAGLLLALNVRFGRFWPTNVFVLPVSRKPPAPVAVIAVPPSKLPATDSALLPSESGTAAIIVRSFTDAAAVSAGANAVPLGTNTLSDPAGTVAGFQFAPVVHAVLVVPIQVRVVPVGMP